MPQRNDCLMYFNVLTYVFFVDTFNAPREQCAYPTLVFIDPIVDVARNKREIDVK